MKIGVAKVDITVRSKKVFLQGFADTRQKSDGVLHKIYSRAFYLKNDGIDLVIVVADIWSCTKHLKDKVILTVNELFGKKVISDQNLMLMGTHTHSAPGGYSGYHLYDQPNGINKSVINKYVSGIANSIVSSIISSAKGSAYVGRGTVSNCGVQRSSMAYDNNPKSELSKYPLNTDNSMTLLRLVHHNDNGTDTELGLINWYAIHPTDLGQLNKKISGDNKGWASKLFEDYAKSSLSNPSYVAAFANGNCGDVTGHIRSQFNSDAGDLERMKKHGKLQYDAAKTIFNAPLKELTASLDICYGIQDLSRTRIKNTHKRTWPYALGLSFASGSMEDSLSVMGCGKLVIEVGGTKEGLKYPDIAYTKYERTRGLYAKLMAAFLGARLPIAIGKKEHKGHYPKPILVAPRRKQNLAPIKLPFQIFKLGELAILGCPGELSTMAGRRVKEALLKQLKPHHIDTIALSCYTNEYCQYTVTPQEYNIQHYEGASTPYGPHTLTAFTQEFSSLLSEEDQYIDCENKTHHEVKFEVSAQVNGKPKTFKMTRSEDYFRFSLPASIKEYKVRCHYRKKNRVWQQTPWVKEASHGSGSATHIMFENDRTISLGPIAHKKVYYAYDGIDYARFYCNYLTKSGKKETLKSELFQNWRDSFSIPWDATDINIYAILQAEIKTRVKIKTQAINPLLKSHEEAYVEVKNGLIIERDKRGNWW